MRQADEGTEIIKIGHRVFVGKRGSCKPAKRMSGKFQGGRIKGLTHNRRRLSKKARRGFKGGGYNHGYVRHKLESLCYPQACCRKSRVTLPEDSEIE